MSGGKNPWAQKNNKILEEFTMNLTTRCFAHLIATLRVSSHSSRIYLESIPFKGQKGEIYVKLWMAWEEGRSALWLQASHWAAACEDQPPAYWHFSHKLDFSLSPRLPHIHEHYIGTIGIWCIYIYTHLSLVLSVIIKEKDYATIGFNGTIAKTFPLFGLGILVLLGSKAPLPFPLFHHLYFIH